MLKLVQSNRLESLADALLDALGQSQASPLVEWPVVVEGRGVREWLATYIADRVGICAGIRFELPASFAWSVLRKVVGGLPSRSAYQVEVLQWRLLLLFRNLPNEPGYAPLQRYLASGDELQAYQFAGQLAETFDRYLLFRPEWILAWERGEESHWQASLWRALAADKPLHWVTLLQRANREFSSGSGVAAVLPQQLHFFGLQGLSPSYLSLLSGLAGQVDTVIYQLNPSEGYWGDILSPGSIARGEAAQAEFTAYAESGNELLAMLGATGRDRLEMLQELSADEQTLFTPPEGGSLLSSLQRGILQLEELHADEKAPALAADRSICFHDCHSALREIEVLHDQLLALFADQPELQPADVLVATPDPTAYWPLVEAVFAGAEGLRRIPFTLSSVPGASGVSALFTELVALAQGRYPVTAVMGLLDWPMVRRRFDIAEEELPELQRWIQAAGIHWGIDRAHARQLSGAEISGQSWREGIDRLLLGYAATTGMVEPLDGLLPMGDIDGGDADLLARFLAFFDGVAELQGLLAGRRQIASWGQAMVAVLETLVRTDEPDSDGLFGVIGCITQLSDNAALAGLTTEIAFAPWWAALERLLASQPDFGTASGGVRFVPLSAGQIVPARVICLLGLNEESFPRNENRRGYDLMAAAPRRGDRMRNADDRYLFLEALISARETLYLSYQGRRAEDDQPCSPSTVISELLDYLQSSLGLADSRELVTRHPLQPFSPRYYSGDEDSPLFSYVPDYCPVGEPEPVVKSPPGGVESSTVPGQVSLDQLVAFLKNPARYRLLNVLGIDLRPDERWPQASELLEPDGLDNWRLEQEALRGLQRESGHDVVAARLMASGLLPDTGWGKLLAREAITRVDSISAELIAAGYLEPPEPRPFELLCDALRLEGALPVRGGCRLIQFHTGRTHGKQLLELWVNHLALSCALGERAETVWVRPGSAVRLSAVSEPQTVLADLLQLYLQGVSRPLHFFPKSASEFVQAWAKDDEPDLIRARKAAIAAWRGSSMFSGEADDPYYLRAFADPEQCLDLEFEDLALRVFRPLLDELGAQL